MIRPQAARRPQQHGSQCVVKWDRNLKPKLAIMRQGTSVTDRRTDRRTDGLASWHKREMYILHLALKSEKLPLLWKKVWILVYNININENITTKELTETLYITMNAYLRHSSINFNIFWHVNNHGVSAIICLLLSICNPSWICSEITKVKIPFFDVTSCAQHAVY